MDHRKFQISNFKFQIWRFLGKTAPAVFAQTPHDLGSIGGEEGFGPWGNLGNKGIKEAAGALTSIISQLIGIMTIIAGIWFIFQFIIGAYGYMTAGGEQQKMTNATKKITSALIGLIVVVAAYAIMSLLGQLLGFEFLNLAPLIENLKPK
jgi:hypothetical protein